MGPTGGQRSMVKKSHSTVYVPERGDLVWINFDHGSGHEQRGHRPAVILSRKEYNQLVGLAVVCPITTQIKDYPFEVKVNIKGTDSVVLSDHVRSISWKTRDLEYIGFVAESVIRQIVDKIVEIVQ